jgi:metal-responsive CopG/Arc/MetJ family transcriptional regulator
MKSKAILIRLDDQTYASLNLAAERLGISRTELLRTFLRQGLLGYDRKHEEVMDRMNLLEKSIAQSSELNAVTTAMVAALNHPRYSSSEKEEIHANIKQGISLVSAGLLTQRQAISCTGVK